jgi:hypothetical protein
MTVTSVAAAGVMIAAVSMTVAMKRVRLMFAVRRL